MKPKSLNGKELSGLMLSGLASSYVAAINEGALPNIANAWNYICENQCYEAIQESYMKYEKTVKDILQNKFPLSEDDLKVCLYFIL